MKGTLLSSILICAVISKAAFGNDHQERHDQPHHRINHAANHHQERSLDYHQGRTLDDHDHHHHHNRAQIGKPLSTRQSFVETLFNGFGNAANIPRNFSQFFNVSGYIGNYSNPFSQFFNTSGGNIPYTWNSTNPFSQFFNSSGGSIPYTWNSSNPFSQFTGWFGGGAPNWSNPIQTSSGWPIGYPPFDGLPNPVQSPGQIGSFNITNVFLNCTNSTTEPTESTPSTVPITTSDGSDSTNEDRAKIRSHHGHFKGLKKYRVHAKSHQHEKNHE